MSAAWSESGNCHRVVRGENDAGGCRRVADGKSVGHDLSQSKHLGHRSSAPGKYMPNMGKRTHLEDAVGRETVDHKMLRALRLVGGAGVGRVGFRRFLIGFAPGPGGTIKWIPDQVRDDKWKSGMTERSPG